MANSSTQNSHQPTRTSDFIGSIGVNTHIDFTWTSYGNIELVKTAINYLGVQNLRDSANSPNAVGVNGTWQSVADATGAKFNAYIGQGAPEVMDKGLAYIQSLAKQGILQSIEGANEADGAYSVYYGNSLQLGAQFQEQVFAAGRELGLPVINISFGTGWDKSPTGNYGTVGDLSMHADYANAHIYFGTGNTPGDTIEFMQDTAQLAAHGRPVINTELGWYTTGNPLDNASVSETVQAKYMLDSLLDAYQAGSVKTYLYELLDQSADKGNTEANFGLFRSDGSAKPAAVALHNLTTLLADQGGDFTPVALDYNLSGLQENDNSMLMAKSDGSYWLALWNEARLSGPVSPIDIVVPNHMVTLTLGQAATGITIYDPLTGTTALQSLENGKTAQISLPDHPILVRITNGQGGTAPILDETYTPPPIPVPQVLDPLDLQLTTSAASALAVGESMHINASIDNAWAQHNAGSMVLNLTVGNGTLSMLDASGQAIHGSGTNEIHLSGTLLELNAALSTLTYHASGHDGQVVIGVDVWNQAGVEKTNLVAVHVTSPYDSNDLDIVAPAAQSIKQTPTKLDVVIDDDWAANHAGSMALNLYVTGGTISMQDSNGSGLVHGSGTSELHIYGTLNEINAELATLTYQSTWQNNAALIVDIWNQAGVNVTETIALNTASSSLFEFG